MKKLTLLLVFFHIFLLHGQCDVAITDVNLNTYEVTIEVINSEGCTANGPGGVNGAVTMLQIGYHLPEPIDPNNITVDLFDGDPASANKFNLFKTKALTANETLQLLTEPLIMQESEVLQVTAADANRLHVVASILEINREDK